MPLKLMIIVFVLRPPGCAATYHERYTWRGKCGYVCCADNERFLRILHVRDGNRFRLQ